MEYTIVFDANIYEIIEKVNNLIKEGWIPLGGLDGGGDGPAFYQAMTRSNNENN